MLEHYYSEYFKCYMVKVYDRNGIGLSFSNEDGLFKFLKEKKIDNLTYVEALAELKKLKEKRNA